VARDAGWERAIAAGLAAGQAVADTRFDRLFGPELQRRAWLHFTPVAVALRAAAWLTEGGAAEVADLGAGAGKFCLVGAAATAARFTGIERRPGLVQVARDAARRMGLDRAQFVEGDLRTVPLRRYQAFYVYDPFSEPEAEPDEWLDPCPPTTDRAQFVEGDLRTVPLRRYQAFYVYDPFSEPEAEPDEWLDPCPPTTDRAADVALLLARLGEAPPGTRAAIFCGLGGPTPPGYRLDAALPMNDRGDTLECWVRRGG